MNVESFMPFVMVILYNNVGPDKRAISILKK